MTELDNLALFAAGLVVAIPAGIVVVALVYAAGIDEREEKKLRMQREPGTTEAA